MVERPVSQQAAIEWIAHLEHENSILRDMVSEALTALHQHTVAAQRRNARIHELTIHADIIGQELQAFRAEARRQADGV